MLALKQMQGKADPKGAQDLLFQDSKPEVHGQAAQESGLQGLHDPHPWI